MSKIVFQIVAIFVVALSIGFASLVRAEEKIWVPVVDGDWWQIAEKRPDVGDYNNPDKHNACDFSIWQAADGTWQLESCIRQVNWPVVGERIFHRWETQNLTDKKMWTPQGVSLTPREELNQYSSIQAPHCFKYDGKYYFFYNAGSVEGASVPFDPENPRKPRTTGTAAFARMSTDGKTFTDIPAPNSKLGAGFGFFKMGRDVMLFHDTDRSRWLAYYTENTPKHLLEKIGKSGYMAVRTAPALEGPWSAETTDIQVRENPESPFVIKYKGKYYLWAQMFVFVSDDPTKFPAEPITQMTNMLFHGYYAPEIIEHEGDYYIAGYGQGISLAKIRWVEKSLEEIAAWRADWLPKSREFSRRSEENARKLKEKK